uniref:Polyprotein n=1 Tax=Suillus luteus hypovirus 2 TaxID=3067808 RepID=A0AA49X7Z9_9VIRU|nr:polyprotein [Suillus luteus hypovirus 2]
MSSRHNTQRRVRFEEDTMSTGVSLRDDESVSSVESFHSLEGEGGVEIGLIEPLEEEEPGYCYVVLFSEEWRERAREALGAYPPFMRVKSFLTHERRNHEDRFLLTARFGLAGMRRLRPVAYHIEISEGPDAVAVEIICEFNHHMTAPLGGRSGGRAAEPRFGNYAYAGRTCELVHSGWKMTCGQCDGGAPASQARWYREIGGSVLFHRTCAKHLWMADQEREDDEDTDDLFACSSSGSSTAVASPDVGPSRPTLSVPVVNLPKPMTTFSPVTPVAFTREDIAAAVMAETRPSESDLFEDAPLTPPVVRVPCSSLDGAMSMERAQERSRRLLEIEEETNRLRDRQRELDRRLLAPGALESSRKGVEKLMGHVPGVTLPKTEPTVASGPPTSRRRPAKPTGKGVTAASRIANAFEHVVHAQNRLEALERKAAIAFRKATPVQRCARPLKTMNYNSGWVRAFSGLTARCYGEKASKGISPCRRAPRAKHSLPGKAPDRLPGRWVDSFSFTTSGKSGPRRVSVNPKEDGFCYLLTVPITHRAAVGKLGPYPTVSAVQARCRALGFLFNASLVRIETGFYHSIQEEGLKRTRVFNREWRIGGLDPAHKQEDDMSSVKAWLADMDDRPAARRSLSVTRSNALRRRSRSPSPATPAVVVTSATDTSGGGEHPDVEVRVSFGDAKNSRPRLNVNTKISGQKGLRPLILSDGMDEIPIEDLPTASEFSAFINDNPQSASLWAQDPIDDGTMDKEMTVNALLAGPARTFDQMSFKEGWRKGWTQKEILAALARTGQAARTPIEPMSAIPVVKRGDVTQTTTCFYQALRYVLPVEYWNKLDPRVTSPGDLTWSMYRYAAWVCGLKKYDERCFLIELGKVVGWDASGQPVVQDHIEYYGTTRMVRKARALPLGISLGKDMKSRMVSDGFTHKMLIYGSELFPTNPAECTMRQNFQFYADTGGSPAEDPMVTGWLESEQARERGDAPLNNHFGWLVLHTGYTLWLPFQLRNQGFEPVPLVPVGTSFRVAERIVGTERFELMAGLDGVLSAPGLVGQFTIDDLALAKEIPHCSRLNGRRLLDCNPGWKATADALGRDVKGLQDLVDQYDDALNHRQQAMKDLERTIQELEAGTVDRLWTPTLAQRLGKVLAMSQSRVRALMQKISRALKEDVSMRHERSPAASDEEHDAESLWSEVGSPVPETETRKTKSQRKRHRVKLRKKVLVGQGRFSAPTGPNLAETDVARLHPNIHLARVQPASCRNADKAADDRVASFRDLAVDYQRLKDRLNSVASTTTKARAFVLVEPPSFFYSRFRGYRLCALVGGRSLHVRGMDFRRPLLADPLMLMDIGHKEFWHQPGYSFRLTLLGLRKVYGRLGDDDKRHVERFMGMTTTDLEGLFANLHKIARNSTMADIELNPGPPMRKFYVGCDTLLDPIPACAVIDIGVGETGEALSRAPEPPEGMYNVLQIPCGFGKGILSSHYPDSFIDIGGGRPLSMEEIGRHSNDKVILMSVGDELPAGIAFDRVILANRHPTLAAGPEWACTLEEARTWFSETVSRCVKGSRLRVVDSATQMVVEALTYAGIHTTTTLVECHACDKTLRVVDGVPSVSGYTCPSQHRNVTVRLRTKDGVPYDLEAVSAFGAATRAPRILDLSHSGRKPRRPALKGYSVIHRGNEADCFKSPKRVNRPTGLLYGWTDMSVKTVLYEFSEEEKEIISAMQDFSRGLDVVDVSGEVVEIFRPTINFVAYARKPRPDELLIVVPMVTGNVRELGAWRLLPWLAGLPTTYYRIRNGDMNNSFDFELGMREGGVFTDNHCNALPVLLNNAGAFGQTLKRDTWSFVREHMFVYGVDEVVLYSAGVTLNAVIRKLHFPDRSDREFPHKAKVVIWNPDGSMVPATCCRWGYRKRFHHCPMKDELHRKKGKKLLSAGRPQTVSTLGKALAGSVGLTMATVACGYGLSKLSWAPGVRGRTLQGALCAVGVGSFLAASGLAVMRQWSLSEIPVVMEENPNGLYSYSREAWAPDFKFGEGHTVTVLGTYGDLIPPTYYARLAAWAGVRTHVRECHEATQKELAELQRGDLSSFIPNFAKNLLAFRQGYKSTFVPHNPNYGVGASYHLSPSSKYIRKINYGCEKPQYMLHVFMAKTLAEFFNPTFRIGALDDCTLPRSSDGYTLLTNAPMPKAEVLDRRGWACGSAHPDTVLQSEEWLKLSEDERATIPRITNPDHLSILGEYEEVWITGGKGLIDTYLSCRARQELYHGRKLKAVIHVCDNGLDRDYHTMPTTANVVDRTPHAYLGQLMHDGHRLSVGFATRVVAWWDFEKINMPRRIRSVIFGCLKATGIYLGVSTYWLPWALALLSMEPLLEMLWQKREHLKPLLGRFMSVVWTAPLVLYSPIAGAMLAAPFVCGTVLLSAAADLDNFVWGDTYLLIEPVSDFPMPFGHTVLVDGRTGERFEGVFPEESGFGRLFKLVSRFRGTKKGAWMIPVPFNPQELRSMIAETRDDAIVGKYGPGHSCHTLTLDIVSRTSVIGTSVMLPIWIMGLGVLVPGSWWSTMLDKFEVTINGRKASQVLAFAADELTAAAVIEDHMKVVECDDYDDGTDTDAEDEPAEPDDFPVPRAEEEHDDLIVNVGMFGVLLKEDLSRDFPKYQIPLDDGTVDVSAKLDGVVDDIVAETCLNALHSVVSRPDPVYEVEVRQVARTLPKVKLTTFEHVVRDLMLLLDRFRDTTPFLAPFITFIREKGYQCREYLSPILNGFTIIGEMIRAYAITCWDMFVKCVSAFIDLFFKNKDANRIKAVWALSNLTKSPKASVRARIEMAKMTGYKRGAFLDDFREHIDKLKAAGERVGAEDVEKIGGPQYRAVRLPSKPLASDAEAAAQGWSPDDYTSLEWYNSRIGELHDMGVPQGIDGVWIGQADPERLRNSVSRYKGWYDPVDSEDRELAMKIAEEMARQYPEQILNAEVTTPRAAWAYLQRKIGPQAPFVGVYKDRVAMAEAGWGRAMIDEVMRCIEEGEFPKSFHSTFEKAQVVDANKVVGPGRRDPGTGKFTFEVSSSPKPIRTVCSEGLLTVLISQVFGLAINKAQDWTVTGAGIGMPLNGNMWTLYKQLRDFKNQTGGSYIIADATEYDSRTKPFAYEVLGRMAELGFAHKPNGNAMASYIKAHYDHLQSSWIFGITEPKYQAVSIAIPSGEGKTSLAATDSRFVDHETLLPDGFVERFKATWASSHPDSPGSRQAMYDALNERLRDVRVPAGKILLTWGEETSPTTAPYMGAWLLEKPTGIRANLENRAALAAHPSTQAFRSVTERNAKLREFASIMIDSENQVMNFGNVHDKNRGGGTGEAFTSKTNVYGYKASIIAAWIRYYALVGIHKSPADFFKENVLANTGDDTAWSMAIKPSELDVERFRRCAEHYGVWLDIQAVKKLKDVEYLGQRVRTPTRADQDVLDVLRRTMPTSQQQLLHEDGIVYRSTENLLLRATAMRYYQASPRNNRYLFALIDRATGQAQCTAFVPEMWNLLARHYTEDVNRLFKLQGIRAFAMVAEDQYGLPAVAIRRDNQHLTARQQDTLTWLKGRRFPSYYKVVRTHMTPAAKPQGEVEKFLAKIKKKAKYRPYEVFDEIAKFGMDSFMTMLQDMPRRVRDFMKPQAGVWAEQAFVFPTEKNYAALFILRERGCQTQEEFASAARESPYGSGISAPAVWQEWQDPKFQEKVMQHPTSVYKNLSCLVTIVYAALSVVEKAVVRLPLIGALYQLLMFLNVDISKAYAVLNMAFWHSRAASSRHISSLMPKDPYVYSKRFAMFLVGMVPVETGYVLPFDLLVDRFPELVEGVADWLHATGELSSVSKDITSTADPASNKWSAYVHKILTELQINRKAFVAADVGVGKSTEQIAAAYSMKTQFAVKKIWLVVPRRILRDSWGTRWNLNHQTLKGTTPLDPYADVYVCTYGHFRRSRLRSVGEDDLVYLDEVHELGGSQIATISDLIERRVRTVLMTATPVAVPGLDGTAFFDVPIPKRFDTTVHVNDADVLTNFFEAKKLWPDPKFRWLIVQPSIREVRETIEQLSAEKFQAVEVSSAAGCNRIPEGEGVIMVATSIVDAGLNPDADVLVDSGRTVQIDQGQFIRPVPPTDPNTNKQRMGRVGRSAPGYIIQPSWAGTGEIPMSYPSGSEFVHPAVAAYYGLPQILEVGDEAYHPDFPYLAIKMWRRYGSEYVTLDDPAFGPSEKAGVFFLHLLALSGIQRSDWEAKFTRFFVQSLHLGEDFEHIHSLMARLPAACAFDRAVHYLDQPVAFYKFANPTGEPELLPTQPVYPIAGQWRTTVSSRTQYKAKKMSEAARNYDHEVAYLKGKYEYELTVIKTAYTELASKVATKVKTTRDEIALRRAQQEALSTTINLAGQQYDEDVLLESSLDITVMKVDGATGHDVVQYGTRCRHCSVKDYHLHPFGSVTFKGVKNYSWSFCPDNTDEFATPDLVSTTTRPDPAGPLKRIMPSMKKKGGKGTRSPRPA